ncbi:nucleotidyltransferase family protein [Chryseobacterium terrae]|uniref:Nucleotidyltransferase family protein n=1 Tax=Chryseobacterium terrae TaxID=3163299 RepID=A0ABW8Y2T6_9FLAO
METYIPKIKIFLIAAGESKRMGSPKQLLPWKNKTLIEHQIDNLSKLGFEINVVLGANAELIKNKIQNKNIHIIINEDWSNGMGSSISCAAHHIGDFIESYDGILIALVDQPLITTEYFHKMIKIFEVGKMNIIVSQSDSGVKGAPVLFDIFYADELKNLNGEKGAKPILEKNKENIVLMPPNAFLSDMDTPEEYNDLLLRANHQS